MDFSGSEKLRTPPLSGGGERRKVLLWALARGLQCEQQPREVTGTGLGCEGDASSFLPVLTFVMEVEG